MWNCTLIHSIKLCECITLHPHTETHTHTRACAHTMEFSHSILVCTGNHISRASFCDIQTVEFELLAHTPHFRLFQWRSQNMLHYLMALFSYDIAASSARMPAVLGGKKCKILSEGLFLTYTLKPKSEFCKTLEIWNWWFLDNAFMLCFYYMNTREKGQNRSPKTTVSMCKSATCSGRV